jgi:hypothetical protein
MFTLRLLSKALAWLTPSAAAVVWSISASATLVFEPVINFVPGSGPSDLFFPLYDPTFVDSLTGEHPFLANQPGEIDTVSIGYPRDEDLLTFSVWNNTTYNLTSLKLTIIGTSFQPDGQESWVITRSPDFDARFGDASGDGKVGLSDIFGTITVSDDGKTITLSDGLIPANGHFTDFIYAFTTDGLPYKVGVDTSFDGVLAPEPSTAALLLAGCGATLLLRRIGDTTPWVQHRKLRGRRRSARTTHSLWMIDNIDARVPEPRTILLLGTALVAGAVTRWRKLARLCSRLFPPICQLLPNRAAMSGSRTNSTTAGTITSG